MIIVAGGRGLLGVVVCVTILVGNFAAALNGDRSQHNWQPLRRASDTLFHLTAPDGKTSEIGLGGGATRVRKFREVNPSPIPNPNPKT